MSFGHLLGCKSQTLPCLVFEETCAGFKNIIVLGDKFTNLNNNSFICFFLSFFLSLFIYLFIYLFFI